MADAKNEETLLTPAQSLACIHDVAERLRSDIVAPEKRVIVGIRRGGAVIARLLRDHLAERMDLTFPIGYLDITFYRDDLDTIGPNPVVGATDLSMDIDDKRIVLVDDVLFTGRTIRAALNALFDYGRPEIVDLLVLVDRGNRQLPIQPDYTGLRVKDASVRESIKLVYKDEENPEDISVVRRRLP
ncbi:MAG: bifunctional pyr operon transcriptional regulator/uracil phosphoribosyltransferase PyrR [Magnetococcales bacterium]|nr:bifunctional pyr operon transcriptional regulator/uracil phosphoribosyltransferase PyrR [Magnetococcales bacterium]